MNEPETAVWMGRLAELSRTEGELPDPALIWWKARLLERQAAQARVARPIAIAQWLSLAVAVVTTMVLCAVNWPGIKGMLEPAGFALWAAAAGGVVLMGLVCGSCSGSEWGRPPAGVPSGPGLSGRWITQFP